MACLAKRASTHMEENLDKGRESKYRIIVDSRRTGRRGHSLPTKPSTVSYCEQHVVGGVTTMTHLVFFCFVGS
ncbi:MAG: hypothetical protein A2170_01320 [Deltaproteobacteria bacterium RBG_13_53_10]|nr:MAG: hypothetical protein A2170_01320 [Deltaproteobacteria bacterium RBG_13_53_10]